MAGPQGLDYQLAAVKFTEGTDTKTQAKLVVPGKWNKLDNLTLSQDETPKRRDGVTSLVSGRTGNGLATHNNQLLAINGGDVYSVVKANSTANQVTGRHSFIGISKSEVQRNLGMQDSCDVAVGSTDGSTAKQLTCYVWREKTGGAVVTGVNVALFDETTGAVLIPSTQMHTNAGVFCPRVVFAPNVMGAGGTFYIFYIRGTSLYCRTILTSSPTVLNAEVALITSANLANLNFDATAYGTVASLNTTATVTYGWADGVTSVRCIKVTHAAGVPSISGAPINLVTEITLPIANLVGLAIVPFSSTVCGVWAYGFTTTPYVILNAALAVTASGTVPITPAVNNPCHVCGCVRVDGKVQMFFDQRSSWGTNASLPIITAVFTSAGAVFAGPGYVVYSSDFAGGATDPAGPRGPYIAGKPIPSGGFGAALPVEVLENYQGLAATKANNNQQSTFFMLDVQSIDPALATTTGVMVAHALYGAVGVATINNSAPTVCTPCTTPSLGTGGYIYATTERTLLSFVGGFNISPTGVVRLTLTPNTTEAPIKAQLGESTYLSGGNLSNFDGLRISEHPFPLFPEGINVEVVAGGGAMTAGAHQVVVIAEYVDGSGQRHQSAPSLPVTATVAANDRLRVRVPTLHLTQLGTAVKLVAYITQAAGLAFNRVATTAAGAAGTDNDPTVASVTLPLIDQADTVYAGNELLYNQPNFANTTLPNLAPPPCDALWMHAGRLFLNQADQPGTLGYSQPFANNVGLQFNPALALTWPVGEGGVFRAGAELDEKTIVFCSRKLYVSYGSGPNAAGNFSNYSELQKIPSDVGCSAPRSILEMPQGIIFKSEKGFYLLGRDLSVRYIGGGVAAFDSYNITSAVLLEDRQECRFGTDSTTHPQLIYSYLGEGQWSTTSYQATYVTTDAMWWPVQGQYVAIDLTRGLQTDHANKYDNFAGGVQAISWVARTSFLHLAALGGFQRCRWVFLTGTAQTASPMGGNSPQTDLTVDVYLNDVYTSAAYSFLVDLNAISFPNPLDTVDLRHKLETQKGKSYAFQFTETPDETEAFNGYQLDGIQALTLEVGLRRGTLKLPAAQGVS